MIEIKPEWFEELHEDLVDMVSETVARYAEELNLNGDIKVWDPIRIGDKVRLAVEVFVEVARQE
jgi:hypothetical protein